MSVPALTSRLLASLPGVRHAFFTRQGGVSEGVYASLNLGALAADCAPVLLADPEARVVAAATARAEWIW